VATTKEKRRANRARRLIRSEHRWLQKAIFALSKAEETRDKLAGLHDGEAPDLLVPINGSEHEVEAVGSALREVVQRRMDEQREELRERMRLR
jgi:hypothetical protein